MQIGFIRNRSQLSGGLFWLHIKFSGSIEAADNLKCENVSLSKRHRGHVVILQTTESRHQNVYNTGFSKTLTCYLPNYTASHPRRQWFESLHFPDAVHHWKYERCQWYWYVVRKRSGSGLMCFDIAQCVFVCIMTCVWRFVYFRRRCMIS